MRESVFWISLMKLDFSAGKSSEIWEPMSLRLNRQKVTSVAEAQAQAQKAENGSLLVRLKRGEASLFAALEQK